MEFIDGRVKVIQVFNNVMTNNFLKLIIAERPGGAVNVMHDVRPVLRFDIHGHGLRMRFPGMTDDQFFFALTFEIIHGRILTEKTGTATEKWGLFRRFTKR